MSSSQDAWRINTPPFGDGPSGTGTQYAENERRASYSAHDFPAPPGVAPLPTARSTRPAGGHRLAGLLVASIVSAVVGAGAGIGSYAVATSAEQTGAAPVTVSSGSAANTPTVDGTVTAAAAKIEPSVVTITVRTAQGGDLGTGVVLDADGHILTNNHVVEAARQSGSITVTFHDGTTAEATIAGTAESTDLAVIKVKPSASLHPATFAKSTALRVGQSVVAVGAPLGLSETVTSGIVSNTARPVRSGSNNDAVYLAVQTDAAINPGNSGGPLVDLNGAVVGINSSIASTGSDASGGQSGNIGIGFAIPSDVAVRVADDLIKSGSSPNAALGVSVGGSDSEFSTQAGVPLHSVAAGGAAAEAGLRAGDVLTKINDFPTTTPDGLIAATRFYAPGTKVTVTYVRDGESHTVEATLGTM